MVVAGCAAPATSITASSSAAETASASPTAVPTLEATTEEAAEAPPGAITIAVPGPDFVPNEITAPAGTVVFFLDARPADILHNMVIAINAGDVPLAKSANLEAGQTVVFTVHGIEPGTYEFWCTFPGHFEAGMRGTLTIT
jgi:uncharacterized cupredoxin-like copper-binding protein